MASDRFNLEQLLDFDGLNLEQLFDSMETDEAKYSYLNYLCCFCESKLVAFKVGGASLPAGLVEKGISYYTERKEYAQAAVIAAGAGKIEKARELYAKQLSKTINEGVRNFEKKPLAALSGSLDKYLDSRMSFARRVSAAEVVKEYERQISWCKSRKARESADLRHLRKCRLKYIIPKYWEAVLEAGETEKLQQFIRTEIGNGYKRGFNVHYPERLIEMAETAGLTEEAKELELKELEFYLKQNYHKIQNPREIGEHGRRILITAGLAEKYGKTKKAQELYEFLIDNYELVRWYGRARNGGVSFKSHEQIIQYAVRAGLSKKVQEMSSYELKELEKKSPQEETLGLALRVAKTAGMAKKVRELTERLQSLMEKDIRDHDFNEAARAAYSLGMAEKAITYAESGGDLSYALWVAKENGMTEKAKALNVLVSLSEMDLHHALGYIKSHL